MSDDRKAHLDGKAVALLLMCCALWGLGQVATKLTLAEIPPLTQAALRSAGAAVLVLAWMRWRRLPLALGDGTWRAGMLAGALFAAEFACIFTGLQYTTASRMVVFIYLAPFVVALGMPLIARSERLRGLQVLGLLGAFGGVVWAFIEGFTQPRAGDLQWLGDALGIGGAMLWGATTLALRATSLGKALPEKALLYQLVVSAAALAAAAVAVGEHWPARVTAASLVPLAFQTVVITFVSYLVWFWLVRHYPATRVSAFTLLTPLFGLLAGVLVLNDPLTMRLVVALVAVCLGIALVNHSPRPAPKTLKENR
jgi:drug/metabolite transporter (DMT)-like permease